MTNKDRVLGALLGAAAGDAMGAPSETKTPAMIKERFNGYIQTLLPGEPDTFVKDCPAGTITDDFSLAYFTAWNLARCRGNVTHEVAVKSLLDWADHPEFFRFAGPTTQASVLKLQGKEVDSGLDFMACDNHKATNGSAMKIFPVGLINPGDIDKAIKDTATICLPTHTSSASISGAAAISAAVAKAVVGASLDEVLEAGIYGAHNGLIIGEKVGDINSVASVEKRIRLAIEIGKNAIGWENAMLELGSIIGSGIAINEAVPCVFGILVATGGKALESIRMGANIGNDTDTVATMTGAIAGAMCGYKVFPDDWIRQIDKVNNIDICLLANAILQNYYE